MSMFERLAAERLAEIDARYPAAHMQQVTARLRRAWEKQPAADRIPYVVLHYRQDGFAPQDDLSAWENVISCPAARVSYNRVGNGMMTTVPVFHFGTPPRRSTFPGVSFGLGTGKAFERGTGRSGRKRSAGRRPGGVYGT